MGCSKSRVEIVDSLREKVARGEPIIGGGAGTGISAKCEEAGGIDLIVIYNSGRFRMAGRGSTAGLMPYGNANKIVLEMAPEVLTVVKRTPVLAGVCATDPFLMLEQHLKQLKDLGFSGIQNFPTVGLFDGRIRVDLEETGMGYGLEVECVRTARKMEMLTTPYVFNPEEAKAMTEAGADIVVAHMGCTTGGSIGTSTGRSLDECVKETQAIVDVCKKLRPDVLVLCHGGPIAMPEDASYMLSRVRGIDGFYGASSMERLPAERAITEQARKFNALRLNGK